VKKRTYLLGVVLIGVLLLAFSLAYAQTPGTGPGMGRMEKAEELKLTDDQKEGVQEIHYNFNKNAIGLKAELKTSRLELRHLLMQDDPDQQQISKLVDRIADAQKKLLKNQVDKKLALKEILTPEQFEKFMMMRGKRMKGDMQRGRGLRHSGRHQLCPRGEGPGF
jgi:Spy/CpxP family protein refolding chaperone